MPAIGSRLPRPRWTLRLRLTLLYGGLFLVAGTVLLGIVYGLVRSSGAVTGNTQFVTRDPGLKQIELPQPFPGGPLPPRVLQGAVVTAQSVRGSGANVVQIRDYAGRVTATFQRMTRAQRAQLAQLSKQAKVKLDAQRHAELSTLLTRSGVALAIMALVSVGLGWLMAGRALRPVRTMSARARGISERNLHERLALDGPNDELKELGDTFDALLARLENAFESQRRFVANASHELRTPITLSRTLSEVALADPGATRESLRDTLKRVLGADARQERLIEALLTLARSQRGLSFREEIDLGAIAGEVVRGTSWNGVRMESSLGDAPVAGDPALVERLIGNLLDNAIHYNQPGGWVRTWTGMRDGHPTVSVTNSGPVVPAEQIPELVEPFRRLNGERAANPRGLGLGLSIVSAIATAHDAEFLATARAEGGLETEVRFPAS